MSDSVKNPPSSGPGRGSDKAPDEAVGYGQGGAHADSAPNTGPFTGPFSPPGTGPFLAPSNSPLPGAISGDREGVSSGGPGHEPSWVRKVDPRLGQTFGKYQVEAVIGKGGMGLVYEGVDIILGRRVAIKFLPELLTENPKAI